MRGVEERKMSELQSQLRKFSFVDENHHVSTKTIRIQFGVGMVTVHKITYEDLSMCKIGAKFIPRVLRMSILVTNYLIEIGIKTIPHLLYGPGLTPRDLWLFPETAILKMKEAVARVMGTFTLKKFYGAFLKWLELYNRCIEVKGCYLEGDLHFFEINQFLS